MDRTLDWHPRTNPDPRSLSLFGIADHFSSAQKPRKRIWKRTIWLDQGQQGACVGFGCSHALGTSPRRFPSITNDSARAVYLDAKRNDEYAGEDYEGSSVLGGMKALKAEGSITDYYWAKTLNEVILGVGYRGPMVAGVNWYSGMFTPDDAGRIAVSGQIEGGHCLLIGGVIPETQEFELYNSWGPDWGNHGSCTISFADTERLMSEQGEFALPVKVRP